MCEDTRLICSCIAWQLSLSLRGLARVYVRQLSSYGTNQSQVMNMDGLVDRKDVGDIPQWLLSKGVNADIVAAFDGEKLMAIIT